MYDTDGEYNEFDDEAYPYGNEDTYQHKEDDPYEDEAVYSYEGSARDNISDSWSEFKETDQWDLLVNDPIEFASQYLEMFLENKGKTVIVIIAFLLFFVFARGSSSVYKSEELAQQQQRYINLNGIIKQFVEQENDIQPLTAMNLRRSFMRASRRVVGLDSQEKVKQQPVVLLFAAKDQVHIHSLVQKFVSAIDKYPDIFVTEFDCDYLISRMEFEKNIFTQLHDAHPKHRLLILNNIDRLSETTPLVLHSLADNESSPFKDVVIIATITLNQLPKEMLDSRKCNGLISKHLLDVWTSKNLSIDQIHPIISRLSGAPICYK